MIELLEINISNKKMKIKEGDFIVLFGSDAAGKTHLLHTIMRLQRQETGEVNILMDPDKGEEERLRNIRIVPDEIIEEPVATGRDYLSYAQACTKDYDLELQENLCERFKLPLDEQLSNMTIQENKMVQITAALCAMPSILILDEPMNFLTDPTYMEVLRLLKKLTEKRMGVFITTEKYANSFGYCTQRAFMKDREIILYEEVPQYDIRKKIVTIVGGNREDIKELMDKTIYEDQNMGVYLCIKEFKSLLQLIENTHCIDWYVEKMTLEEEVLNDFSRWEK